MPSLVLRRYGRMPLTSKTRHACKYNNSNSSSHCEDSAHHEARGERGKGRQRLDLWNKGVSVRVCVCVCVSVSVRERERELLAHVSCHAACTHCILQWESTRNAMYACMHGYFTWPHLTSAPASSPQFQLFGVTTYYQLAEDGCITVRMEGGLDDLPFFEQAAVIHDVDNFKNWVPCCDESR